MPHTFFDTSGKPLNIGRKLGEGGEGAVFDIDGQVDFVAKIYHETISTQKEAKLKVMAQQNNAQLQNIGAWPVEILQDKKGKISGFIMPKIFGYKPIHELYSPKSRRQEFPHADWRFLLHVAANSARAVSVIHQHGHVIGDLNHGNLVVAANGTVKLIDCDSFQIREQEKAFLCEVGVVEYTPPELHNRDFTKALRTENHDAFGLAVLMFHLLFMGRHPFAGRFLGQGDMPIYKAIRENRFAYSTQAQRFQMQPPPFTLPTSTLPAELFQLFEKAFLAGTIYGTDRPKATDWIELLTRFSNNIRTCSLNLAHHFYAALPTCPWCKLERELGVDLFVVTQSNINISGFNIHAIWLQIAGVKSPGKAPVLPLMQAQPTAIARKVREQTVLFKSLAIVFAFAAILGGLFLFNTGFFWVMWVLGGLAAHFLWNRQPVKNKIHLQYTLAEGRLNSVQNEWESLAGDSKFKIKFRELESFKNEYIDLPNFRKREMENLNTKLKEKQLERYLEGFRISDTKFDNIGVERKSMLLSYGIENAADVEKKAVSAVPGFGRVLTLKLLDWRRELEQKFVFNPYKGVDPRDVADLDRHISIRKKMLENELLQGAQELKKISQEILLARDRIKPRLEQAIRDFAQAEADKRYISGLD